jgi:histidinol-phosphatase (PHP family)
VLPDYHIHTALCKHAVGETPAYAAAARARGIPEICFSDHGPNPHGYDEAHRMEMHQFGDYLKSVSAARGGAIPQVLLGIETDYYPGCEGFLREWLPFQPFDLVLGSVHFIGEWGFDSPSERGIWETVDVTRAWRDYFELIGRLAETGLYDVVGHLDLPKKYGYRPSDGDLAEMAKPALDRISRAGMGIEINTGGLRKPVREIYPSAMLLSLAKERGISICFGSDAHSPGEVGEGFEAALALARSAGYTDYFKIRRRKRMVVSLPDISSFVST